MVKNEHLIDPENNELFTESEASLYKSSIRFACTELSLAGAGLILLIYGVANKNLPQIAGSSMVLIYGTGTGVGNMIQAHDIQHAAQTRHEKNALPLEYTE